MFAGKKSAQIREILISESAWEEMTCLFAPSIEQAIDYRDNKGVPLKILSEEQWQTLMRDNNSLSQ